MRLAVMDSDDWPKLSRALMEEIMVAITPGAGKKRPRRLVSWMPLTKESLKRLKPSELRGELDERGLESAVPPEPKPEAEETEAAPEFDADHEADNLDGDTPMAR